MQKTFKGFSARKVIIKGDIDNDGRRFIKIDGELFTVAVIGETAVVIESLERRVVLAV